VDGLLLGNSIRGGMSTTSFYSSDVDGRSTFLPKGVSQSIAMRMSYDAAYLSPGILDLRLNYRNLMNEMAQNKGQMVSHQFAMMRPRRRPAYKPPRLQDLEIPQHLDQKARKRLAALHRKQRKAAAASAKQQVSTSPARATLRGDALRRQSLAHGAVSGALDEDNGENIDVVEMQDSAGVRALRERSFELEVQQLSNQPNVQEAFHSLGGEDGIPRNMVKRALKALGHFRPEASILDAALKTVPGIEPLSLPDFCVVLNVFCRQRHLLLQQEFKRIDEDGSGKVTVREFRMMLWSGGYSLSDEAVQSVFSEIGTEAFGQVTLEEFEKACVLVEDRHGFTSQEADEFMTAFDRFEPEHPGELSAEEVTAVLAYCGVRATLDQVCSVARDIGDGVHEIVPRAEFLRFLRFVVEQQIEQARVLFSEFDVDCGGTLSEKELKELFLRLGYHLSHTVLNECFQEIGDREELVFEELLKVVHMVREKEGFDVEELQELTEVFVQETQTEQMREFELGHALDWLGYAISYHKRAGIFAKVDMGKVAVLQQKDFFKFMRLVREHEAEVVQEVLSQAKGSGHAINEEDIRMLLGKLNYAPASTVIHAAMQEHIRGERYPDLQALLAVVGFCRREQAVEARNCHGLNPLLSRKIGAKLQKRLGLGKSVNATAVENLMQEIFPIVKQTEQGTAKLHRYIGDQQLGHGGELHDARVAYRLVRVYGDMLAEESWAKEADIIHRGWFSKSQVAQLRHHFVQLTAESASQDLKQVVTDIAAICFEFGAENVRQAINDLIAKVPGALDFADFLQLMQACKVARTTLAEPIIGQEEAVDVQNAWGTRSPKGSPKSVRATLTSISSFMALQGSGETQHTIVQSD